MKVSRLNSMEEYIAGKEFVSLDELCDVFNKSKNTIRRDIGELVAKGSMEKVYGGVRSLRQSASSIVSFNERLSKYMVEKKEIGRMAAEYIENGDTIFIDSGTTTLNLIPYLTQLNNLTILTNNLYVINASLELSNLNLITFGGQLIFKTASFSADFCSLDHMRRFNINKAFMGATGVSIEKGASNTNPSETTIKSQIVAQSNSCLLMADATKFDHSALLTYADLTIFQHVITSHQPPEKYMRYFEDHGITCRHS